MKKINTILFLLVGIISIYFLNSYSVHAHPGRTDVNGGHTCKTNCANWGLEYGEYHYHSGDGSYTNKKGQRYDKNGSLILSETNVSSTTTTVRTTNPNNNQTTTKKTTTEMPKTTQEITVPVTQPQSEKITISFDTNGGEEINPITIPIGEKITLPVPARVGYEFEGWYNKSGLTKITENYDFNDSITIYAKWKEEAKKYDEQTEIVSPQSSSNASIWTMISIFIILSAGYIGFCVYKMRKK